MGFVIANRVLAIWQELKPWSTMAWK